MSPVRWVLGSRLFSVLLVLGHAAGYPAGYTLKGQFYIMYIQPQLKKKKRPISLCLASISPSSRPGK